MMEYKKLGSTSLNISRIGFGCWAIGGYGWGKVNDEESIFAIKRALELGINFFDTADVYGFGHSEEILGKALGKKRKDIVIATKFGLKWDEKGNLERDASPKRIEKALDASLKRLGLDCIPLYQIHWPDPKTQISETMEALKNLQKKGKIKYIGCSNFSPKLIREAQEFCRLESLQGPYNIIEKEIEKETFALAKERQIAVITYSTLAQGLFSGKYRDDAKFDKKDIRSRYENWQGDKFKANLKLVEKLKEIGARYNKTPAQVAIRWVLENPQVTSALIGIKRAEHIEDNIGSLGWDLQKEDRDSLSFA